MACIEATPERVLPRLGTELYRTQRAGAAITPAEWRRVWGAYRARRPGAAWGRGRTGAGRRATARAGAPRRPGSIAVHAAPHSSGPVRTRGDRRAGGDSPTRRRGLRHARRHGFGRDLPRELVDVRDRRLPRLRSEEHTSELQSLRHLVCRLLLENK